ncbi:MAG: 3-phosphoshikimate 1-carboxyvinyltransferase [Sumerlaeia bacterium]
MNVQLQAPTKPLIGVIDPPSSKNYTTRVILASCLAAGESRVNRPAVQDDAVALVRCCKALGANIIAYDDSGKPIEFEVPNGSKIDHLIIHGFGQSPQQPAHNIIDPDNAGAVLRMLMGVLCLCPAPVRVETQHYPHSLGKRPNKDLVDALILLGVKVDSENDDCTLPLTLTGGADWVDQLATKGELNVQISGAISSQYLSSLLFLGPLLPVPLQVDVINGLKSKPLIRTTLEVLNEANVRIQAADDLESFRITPQAFSSRIWNVNGDWPGISAVLAAAAVVPNSDVTIKRMREDQQGERKCLEFYKCMGCTIEWTPDNTESSLRIKSPQKLTAACIDGDKATDAVLAMMSAAACADGESVFTGINNLQFKECDRVREPIQEMKKIFPSGCDATWAPDNEPETITVLGTSKKFSPDLNLEVDGRGDHRVIMLLSVLALHSTQPITITGAHHVAKSFPLWFKTLEQVGVEVIEK